MQLKPTCRPRGMFSRFTIVKRVEQYALNWFNCLMVCPFWAKSGKYYSKSVGSHCL